MVEIKGLRSYSICVCLRRSHDDRVVDARVRVLEFAVCCRCVRKW